MPELTLYVYPGKDDLPSPSPPCAKIMLALAYGQIPHTLVPVKDDPKNASPTGRLPALAIDGETLSDSVLILDRLEALEPARRFWPEDPRERARDLVWERFFNEHLYWREVYLRWNVPETFPRTARVMLPKLPPILNGLFRGFVRREVSKRTHGQGVGLKSVDAVKAEVSRALDTVVAGLGDGPFLEQRATPGRADLAAAAHLAQFPFRDICPWSAAELRARPALIDYLTRVYEACELPVPAGCRAEPAAS